MKKYTSPITKDLTPDNWKEKIDLKSLSLEDLIDIMGDCKAMEKLGKIVAGFTKEAIKARMPEGETEAHSNYWGIQLNERYRAGGLDKDLILEQMGEDWVEEHTKEGTEYVEVRIAPWEGETV